MLNFTAMIQGIDTIFTNFIFIPALLILYLKCKFCSNGTPILKLAVHPF